MEIEDIIAYSIIAIFTLAVIFGAVLLRRRFVRSRTQKVTQMKQHLDQDAEAHDKFYRRQQKQDRLLAQARSEEETQRRDRAERLRIKGMQNVTPIYSNLRNASAQSTINDSQWRTLGGGGGNTSVQRALGGSGGTTSAQPVPEQTSNRTSDLFTGMALGSLVNNLFSSPSYSRPSSDDSDSRKSSFSSWSDSSSSDSSSSDSGPSSDW